MIAYKVITTLLFFVASIYIPATAQQPYFLEENIPSTISEIKHVTGIAADKNNCIWFASQTGVYRYDGNRFRHYSVLNTPVLQFERIGGIIRLQYQKEVRWALADSKGNLYEVDNSSRLRAFSPKQNEQVIFHRFGFPDAAVSANSSIDDSLRKNTFEIYTIAATGKMFLIQENRDILSIDYKDFLAGKKASLLSSLKGYADKLAVTYSNFYFISPGNLFRWKDGLPAPETILLSGDILQKNSSLNFEQLSFLGTTGPGILLLWYDGSVYEAVEEEGKNVLRTRLLINENSKERPYAAFYSPVQQLFIAYFRKRGLVFYRARQFSLLSWNTPGTISNSVDYYYSMIPENNGFITVNDKGIIWLGANGTQKMLKEISCRKFFLFKDLKGNIWYQQSRDEMISRLEPVSGKNISLFSAGTGTELTGVHCINDSTYYLLTNHYFKKIILKKDIIQINQTIYTAPPKVEMNFLYDMGGGIVWIGTDRGLLQFNLSDNSIKNIEALDNTYVRAITAIDKHNYLVGTYDKGIYQYRNDSWIHLSASGKKMPASAHAFIIDTLTSSVWVSSNEGILRFSLAELLNNSEGRTISFAHFSNFGSGIPAEFNGSSNLSAAQLSDSCIGFANAKGLVTFNPLRLVSYPLPVTVLAEPVEKEEMDPANANPYQIEFDPVVPYFGNRQDLDIYYHLTNSDDHWHKFLNNSIISYNNVSPGNHDLQFRISNSHEKDQKEVLIVAKSFTIPYRWYQTTWFKIAAIALALTIVIILHNIRIWYLRKRKRELEELVRTKTSELQKTNSQLSDTIEDLKLSEDNLKQSNYLKDEYFAVLTHDLRSPLRFLSFNICQLLDLMPEIEAAKLKKGLVVAYECTNDVSKLIDDFVYWIRNNENQLKPQPVSTMISPVIADIKKLYGFSMEGNKNEFVTHISPDLRFTTDQQMFFIMIRNAVDNANKYTTEGTITVSAEQRDGNLEVTIADTGSGMNEEMAGQLIQLQYEDAQFGHKKRKSLGFYIMAMLTKKLKARYTINSVTGQGTVLRFVIPDPENSNESPA